MAETGAGEDVDRLNRVRIELERLDQEVRTLKRLLDEGGLGGHGEMVRLLRYMASRAERVAGMIEQSGNPGREP
jgi:hypothetical protein